MMELRQIFIQVLLFGIYLYEKTRRTLAWLFYPFVKIYVEKECSKLGLKFVKGQAKEKNEVGLIGDQKEIYLRFIENFSFGILSCIKDNLVHFTNTVEFMCTVMREKRAFVREFNDGYTWLLNNFNLQTGALAWDIASHYDTGNDLFELMLDPYMQYSCGYWKNATSLAQAQEHKLDLIARKLQLKPGMEVLDIGCGFGGLAKYLAKFYGVSVTGCTISKEQLEYGQKMCTGLPVNLVLCDYQKFETTKKFDRIVSVGFMEHVGKYNYRTLYKIASKCLKSDGLFLLHTMGTNNSYFPRNLKWIHQYIFPNGWFPKLEELISHAEDLFLVEDLHNFGAYYYPTLAAWEKNFDEGWPQLEAKYGDNFYRTWKVYLQSSQATLKSRNVQVYQIVYSKKGIMGGYDSVR